MMIKFKKSELLKNYTKCNSAIKNTNVLPIFSKIRFTISGNNYKMIAANSTYQITTSGQCEGSEEIDICIDSSKFGVVLNAANEDIIFSVKDSNFVAKCGKSKFNLKFLPGGEMPLIDLIDSEIIEIDIPSLISKIHLNAPSDNVNQVLNGVSIELKDKIVNAYATDGFSMAFSSEEVDCENDISIIIPCDVASVIADMNSHSISIKNKRLQVTSDDGSILISKLIDGKMPDFKKIIPNENDYFFNVNRNDLIPIINTCIKSGNDDIRISLSNGVMLACAGDNEFAFDSEISSEGNFEFNESFRIKMLQMLCKIITTEKLKINTNLGERRKYICSDGEKNYLMAPLKS